MPSCPISQSDEPDYEEILSKITETIEKEEIKLARLRYRRRRVRVWTSLLTLLGFIIYGAIAWLGSVSSGEGTSLLTRLRGWLLFLFLPITLTLQWRIVGFYYDRRTTIVNESLELHRDQKRLKIEEFKTKTHYYANRSLIERFDEEGTHAQAPANADGGGAKLRQRRKGEDSGGKKGALASSNSFNRSFGRDAGDPGAGSAMSGTPSKIAPGAAGQGLHLGQSPATPRIVGSLPSNSQSPAMSSAPNGMGPSLLPYPQLHPLSTTPPRRPMLSRPASDTEGSLVREPPRSPLPAPRTWQDRVIDLIVGSDDRNILAQQEAAREREETLPDRRFALVCHHCHGHNGLVRKSEFASVQYICPRCGAFNDHSKHSSESVGGEEVEKTTFQPPSQPQPNDAAKDVRGQPEERRTRSRTSQSKGTLDD